MHYLHKILVYLPEAIPDREGVSRNDVISAVRAYAENVTEDFYGTVFDWRETDTAGRWSNRYPVNVLLCEEDTERFQKELSEAREGQEKEIRFCMEHLEQTAGTDLAQIAKTVWKQCEPTQKLEGVDFMTTYYLNRIASLLNGDYDSDSCFYNSYQYTARLYPADIEKVKQAPADWAMALFDYHN